MNYRIAIPSYRRPETLARKTLSLLKRLDMDMERVTVFVADEAEQQLYFDAVAPFGISPFQVVVVALPGIAAARNAMETHYPPGTPVFCIDDDIKDIAYRRSKKVLAPITDLDAVVRHGFRLCETHGAFLWGIYPVDNPYFMTRTVRTGLCYIAAAVTGFIARHDPTLFVTRSLKEDVERSIRYYIKDRVLVRMEWLTPLTNFYTEPGGIQCYRTRAKEAAAARALVAAFPEYCSLNKTKKSGWTEVRLKDKTKDAENLEPQSDRGGKAPHPPIPAGG